MLFVQQRAMHYVVGLLRVVAILASGLIAGVTQAAFIVNTNGTVTDTATGLVWDRCALGSRTSATVPCLSNVEATYDWPTALAQVSARNSANHLGFNDWRMPNKNELESLVKLDVGDPAIDTIAFPNTPADNYFWTSSPAHDSFGSRAWAVDFYWGHASRQAPWPDSSGATPLRVYVRLVRGGPPFAAFDAYPPVNGACGASHNAGTSPLLADTPATNLCSLGNASAVTAGTTTYSWSCAGLYGGTASNCGAPRGYTVSPDTVGNGSISPATNQVVAYQAAPSFTAIPDVGYMASVWDGTCSGVASGKDNATFTVDPVTANCKLRVSFALGPTHQVSGSRNPTAGGTITCTPKVVSYGGSSTCTQTANAGYAFIGWSGACVGSGACTLTNVTTDQTVTANFGYTVTGVASPSLGGSVTCAPNPVTPGATSTCTASANAGYTLTGVSGCGAGSLSGNTYTTAAVNAACTVTATYTLNTYSITQASNPSAGGTVSCSPNPVAAGATASCTVSSNAGYTVGSVGGCGNGSLSGNTYTTAAINAPCTVTANYSVVTYAITTSTTPTLGGTVTCTPNPVSYGNTANCTQAPNAGWTFVSWGDACFGAGACSLTNVTSNKHVSVSYTRSTYPVTTASNPPAGGTVFCGPNPVYHGDSTICNQVPNVGYTFNNWSGACSGSGGCIPTNVTSSLTVTANYVVSTYQITGWVNMSNSGTITCTPNPVTHGSSTSCTQVPRPAFAFAGWGGPCSGTGPCVITNVTANLLLRAYYELNTFAITSSASPESGGSIICDPSAMAYGNTSTCTATPNLGYVVGIWGGTCGGTASGVGNVTYTTNAVTADCTVTVTFSPGASHAVTGSASPLAGGSVTCTPNPVTYGANADCTQTANVGYTFTGWSGACSGTGGCTLTNVITDQTVTANYSVNTYTVSKVSNPAGSGVVTCTPDPVSHGATTTCSQIPNAGYTFANWSGACAGNAACMPSNVTANLTVTANYNATTYAIATSASPALGGSVVCTPNPVTHGSNSNCSQTPNAGYTFTGWSGACTGTGACSLTNVTTNQTVTANYSLNTYSILKQSNPIAGGTVTCTPDPVNHGAGTTCTQTPNVGYTFVNWSGACAGNGACAPSNVTANLTVTANYNATTYAIATSASPTLGGSVICTPNPVTHGSNSNCSQTPNSGYTFTGWSGACTGTGACSLTNVTANQTVTANYSLNTYSILKQSNPIAGGTVTCTPDPVNHGASTSCTQTPNAGYTFTNWSGACSGSGACTPSNVTANLTVTATYSLNSYSITPVVSPMAGGSVTCTPNPVNHGSSSNCSQTPNTGYTFTGWSGACTGTGACTLANVTANQTVTASYRLNTYTVTGSVSPAAGGSLICVPTTVNHGSTSTCTATPSLGYITGAWGGSCGGTSGGTTYTTNVITADCTVSVAFTALPILNVDDSGAPTAYDAATDGLLLMRYLMGLRGADLVQGILGSNPQRNATQIAAHIDTYLPLFDVDGDGVVHAHTDGLLIYRRMLGLSGAALTRGANQGSRSDSQIAAAIDALRP